MIMLNKLIVVEPQERPTMSTKPMQPRKRTSANQVYDFGKKLNENCIRQKDSRKSSLDWTFEQKAVSYLVAFLVTPFVCKPF